MVGALENVAYTRTITKMGEDIMTDVVELCTMLMTNGQERGDDCQQHPSSSHPEEEIPEEEKAVPTACMQGCPDLYPGHHKVGELQTEQVYKHELIINLPEERRGSPRRTEQERCTQQTLLAETTRTDQEGDHPRQSGRGVLGKAEEGQGISRWDFSNKGVSNDKE